MTLDNFEKFIEQKIVGRGHSYYKGDDVLKVEQVGKEEFNAVVFGTSLYEVYIKITDKIIVESVCNCPYDWGDTCKHEVAVYYKLRQGDFIDTSKKVNELLYNLHDNILRKFVVELIKKDRNFRQSFLQEFDEDYEEDDFSEFGGFDEYNY